jgi:hypothetical protein
VHYERQQAGEVSSATIIASVSNASVKFHENKTSLAKRSETRARAFFLRVNEQRAIRGKER